MWGKTEADIWNRETSRYRLWHWDFDSLVFLLTRLINSDDQFHI